MDGAADRREFRSHWLVCEECWLTLETGLAVRCSSCGTRYHVDCWAAAGGCVSPGCPERIAADNESEKPEKPRREPNAPAPAPEPASLEAARNDTARITAPKAAPAPEPARPPMWLVQAVGGGRPVAEEAGVTVPLALVRDELIASDRARSGIKVWRRAVLVGALVALTIVGVVALSRSQGASAPPRPPASAVDQGGACSATPVVPQTSASASNPADRGSGPCQTPP
jgi:hypothetical protein